MDSNEIDIIINSIGAMAEILWILYDSLVNRGFSEQQSMYLTTEYMTEVFCNTERGDNSEQE